MFSAYVTHWLHVSAPLHSCKGYKTKKTGAFFVAKRKRKREKKERERKERTKEKKVERNKKERKKKEKKLVKERKKREWEKKRKNFEFRSFIHIFFGFSH